MPITSLMREKLILEVRPFCTGLTFTIKCDHSYSVQICFWQKRSAEAMIFLEHSSFLTKFEKTRKNQNSFRALYSIL